MLNTKILTLDDRGKKLEFKITEMGVWKLQKVLIKIGLAFVKCGILESEVTDGVRMAHDTLNAIRDGGMQKLGDLDPDTFEEVASKLLECCEFKVGNSYTPINKDNIEQYILDFVNLAKLEKEVFMMHFGFLKDAMASVFPALSEEGVAADQESTSKPAMYLRS